MVLLIWICTMQNSPMHLILHPVEILMRNIQPILLDLRSKGQNGKLLGHLHQIRLISQQLKQVLVELQLIRLLLRQQYLMNLVQELPLKSREFLQKTIIFQQQFRVLVLLIQQYSHIYYQVLD